MKIGVIVPNIGMSPAALEERRQFLMSQAWPDTQVVLVRNDDGPVSIESESERELASVHIVQQILAHQDQGFDAFIPWCASDPAVVAARERVGVPVVGPLQAACAYATQLGFRFSIITPMSNPRLIRQRVQGFGLGGCLASVRSLNTPVLALRQDLDATAVRLAQLADATVRDDGADAVVLACMALFGFASRIPASVPVIDPATAALHMAQSLVRMRLRHAASTYPFPKSA